MSRKILRSSGAIVAISMLSACASTSQSQGGLTDTIFTTIGNVSEKTFEIGGDAIANAKDFLGLYPTPDNAANADLDGEIDMALMESESTLLSGDSEIIVETAETRVITKQPLETVAALPAADPLVEDPLANLDPLEPINTNANTDAQSVATADLVHEVQSSENLWDIAKTTTGDANNWHVLADINNLAPNAGVFPGQKLTIPADMIKPGYLTTAEVLEPVAPTAATAEINVAEAATDTTRLVIPEADSVTATAAKVVAPIPALDDITANATIFKIGPTESLWDFAKRTTGDATNWKAIAAQNNFSDKQAVTVYPGQNIYVPSDIVKDVNAGTVAKADPLAKPAAATDTTVAAAAPKLNKTDSEAVDAAATVISSGASILDETQPIKIVEAKFQADEGTAAINTAQLAEEATTQLDSNAGQQIMVSGTYYPKAIYNEADFSSSLLMRVSPGTQLTVSKAVGPWYEVMTDKGVGFVHTRDIR